MMLRNPFSRALPVTALQNLAIALAVAGLLAACANIESRPVGPSDFVDYPHFASRYTDARELTDDELQGVQLSFDQHRKFFYRLYTRKLATKPEAEGTVMLAMALAADGSIVDAAIVSNGLNDPEMAGEILTYLKAMRFPVTAENRIRVAKDQLHFFIDEPGGQVSEIKILD